MKNYIPIFLALIVAIGLFVYFLSTKYLLDSVIDLNVTSQDSTNGPQIILKDIDSTDTLSVNYLSKHGAEGIGPVSKWNLTEKLYLNLHPAIVNYIIFHGIVISLAWASMLFMLGVIYKLIKEFGIRFRSKATLISVIPFIVLIFLTGLVLDYLIGTRSNNMMGGEIMEYFNIIFIEPEKVLKLVALAIAIASLIPVGGIMIINIAITETFGKSSTEKIEEQGKKYKILKDNLNVFALYAGLFVAAAIIGTGLQREMIGGQIHNIELIYPDEIIYAYGMSFSFILGLIFIPSLAYLKYYKRKNNIVITEKTSGVSWWKIGSESISDLKLTLSIILPLLTSIAQSYFNIF